jgi:uncharacterized protein YcsI (UPF0317 family)
VFRTGAQLRKEARKGTFSSHTNGLAPGYVQANLVILSSDWAYDFLLFAQRNPKPCPLLEVGDTGDYLTHILAEKADIRTDVPLYRVYKKGELVEERKEIVELWKDNFVYFLIGCSFTFHRALTDAGLTPRHNEEKVNVPMYKTNIECLPAGRFYRSHMIVSMCPFRPSDAKKAFKITREFPTVHGSPVHMGDPYAIGIKDIDSPDYGDSVTIKPGEIPVFWACGVTPQLAALVSKPPVMITHTPGYMFVGDRKDDEYRI